MQLMRQAVLMCALLFGAVGILAVMALRSVPVQSVVRKAASSNGDVNCDGSLSISDPVYLLNYLFSGGTEPCAIAQADPACCTQVTAALEEIAALARGSGASTALLAGTPCTAPVNRMIENGDGTVTDTCTGLVWQADGISADLDLDGAPDYQFNYNQAALIAEQSEVAGYSDWRVPTYGEFETLLRWALEKPYRSPRVPGFSIWFYQGQRYWTSTEARVPPPEPPTYAFMVSLDPENPGFDVNGKDTRLFVVLVRGPLAE